MMTSTAHGRASELAASDDMEPVAGWVDLEVPADELWEVFGRPSAWPVWNRCMTWVRNHRLHEGDLLIWVFEPIRPWYPYLLPAIAPIVEVEPGRSVTWEVTAVPGMYARHTYEVEPLGDGRSRFGSWERAMGPGFRLMRPLWLAHFRFVLDESLRGAQRLESVRRRDGSLERLSRRLGT